MRAPSLDPCTLLALIRICVPDADYIHESALRSLMGELDAHVNAYIRALDRREPPILEVAA